jgi:hypothetical protein
LSFAALTLSGSQPTGMFEKSAEKGQRRQAAPTDFDDA